MFITVISTDELDGNNDYDDHDDHDDHDDQDPDDDLYVKPSRLSDGQKESLQFF